mgnify:CR=1 FL=1
MKTETNHAIDNARGHFETILELHHHGVILPNVQDDIRDRVQEIPLSVCWRCSTFSPVGDTNFEPDEGEILLTTGGPALRVVVKLSNGFASDPVLEWQDWGTKWMPVTYGSPNGDIPTDCDLANEALEWFVSQFWWGE